MKINVYVKTNRVGSGCELELMRDLLKCFYLK